MKARLLLLLAVIAFFYGSGAARARGLKSVAAGCSISAK